ncbi:hypothetical protein TKK_0014692 [Trichogramma kaykai]|uniref:RNA-directed DNA polymerase n=1 Tax=Trichogramma kaykai TaxID=54128 RepID=A0ABD2WD67_9HYME
MRGLAEGATNRQNCTFEKPQVLYLAYQVSSDSFRPPPTKIEAISDYPQPANATELRRFLGMVNYYRQCLPHDAHVQEPLHELLKGLPNKKAKLRWTETALQAFKRCKESIVDATCNTFLRPDAKLVLRTDASNITIGAALEHKEPDGLWLPLGPFSLKLDPTQRKYSTYDCEFLAVSASIKHFERILEGRTFTTWTDHRRLVYAAQQRSDKASPRQVRSLEFISRFNNTLKHTRGEDNVVADALSRTKPSEDTAQDNEVSITTRHLRGTKTLKSQKLKSQRAYAELHRRSTSQRRRTTKSPEQQLGSPTHRLERFRHLVRRRPRSRAPIPTRTTSSPSFRGGA